MGTVAAAGRTRRSQKGRAAEPVASPYRSAREMRDVLDRALAAVDADERAGALLRAAGLRLRFRFPDVHVILDVSASDDADHHVKWTFDSEPGFDPKLDLTMDSATANAYLQGKESLAIAIARGRVRCRGESRTALLYVPAARLLCEPYRRVIAKGYPHLAMD